MTSSIKSTSNSQCSLLDLIEAEEASRILPGKFTDCFTLDEKNDYFLLLIQGFRENNILADDLRALEQEQLFEIAKWVASPSNTYAFGEMTDDELDQVFNIFWNIFLENSEKLQHHEVEILWG